MDTLKEIISVVSVSSVIFGVIMLLCPEGIFSKSFKNAVGIAVIATIVFSIAGIKNISFNFDKFDINSNLSLTAANELKSIEAISACKAYINDILESNNINHVNISVSTNISDSGSIFINEINISCNKNVGAKIKTLLKDIGVKVIVTERE